MTPFGSCKFSDFSREKAQNLFLEIAKSISIVYWSPSQNRYRACFCTASPEMARFTKIARDPGRIQATEAERLARTEDFAKRTKESTHSPTEKEQLVAEKFAPREPATKGELFKGETVGLVTHENFRRRRELLENSGGEIKGKGENGKREEGKGMKRPRVERMLLDDSDSDDSDEEDGGVRENGVVAHNGASRMRRIDESLLKRRRLGTNPDIDSSFLPDRDREREMAAERKRLEQQWLAEQDRIKAEKINITYSFWDGAGHRRTISCTKGTTIGRFLAQVQISFKALRNVSADQLMYIKEDLIIPHHYSFYDFIVTKARGKSGPLFDFGVKEDVRLVNDAGKEKEDAHAGKVVERRWYERHRHIFPASRWEVYDPKKSYDRYTIHGDELW